MNKKKKSNKLETLLASDASNVGLPKVVMIMRWRMICYHLKKGSRNA